MSSKSNKKNGPLREVKKENAPKGKTSVFTLYDGKGREKLSVRRLPQPQALTNELPRTSTGLQSVEQLAFGALQLMLGQASSDGVLHPLEMAQIQRRIEKWYHLERKLIDSMIEEILEQHKNHENAIPDKTNFPLVTHLNEEQRRNLLASLAQIAEADNHITPQERIFLNRSSALLNLDLETTQKAWSAEE